MAFGPEDYEVGSEIPFATILPRPTSRLYVLCSVYVTSLAAFVEFYYMRNVYVLYVALVSTLTR